MSYVIVRGIARVTTDPNTITDLQSGHFIQKAMSTDGTQEWNYIPGNVSGNKWVSVGGNTSASGAEFEDELDLINEYRPTLGLGEFFLEETLVAEGVRVNFGSGQIGIPLDVEIQGISDFINRPEIESIVARFVHTATGNEGYVEISLNDYTDGLNSSVMSGYVDYFSMEGSGSSSSYYYGGGITTFNDINGNPVVNPGDYPDDFGYEMYVVSSVQAKLVTQEQHNLAEKSKFIEIEKIISELPVPAIVETAADNNDSDYALYLKRYENYINYTHLGSGAVDLSIRNTSDNPADYGAQGGISFVANFQNLASNTYGAAFGTENTTNGQAAFVAGIGNSANHFGEFNCGRFGTASLDVPGLNNQLFSPVGTARVFNVGVGNFSVNADGLSVMGNGDVVAPSLTVNRIASETTGKVLITREYFEANSSASANTFKKTIIYDNANNPIPDGSLIQILDAPATGTYIKVHSVKVIYNGDTSDIIISSGEIIYEGTSPFSFSTYIASGHSGGLEVVELDLNDFDPAPDAVKDGKGLMMLNASGFPTNPYEVIIDIEFTIENI